MSTGLYGHQAMGVAPKRMKWYRHAMAGLLGRQSLGGTDVVLDMQAKEGDPACAIIGQQQVGQWSARITWRRHGQPRGKR